MSLRKFRLFVGNEYAFLPNLHRTAKRFHEVNRERDTAIVSLFLGSGIRLSELVGLDIENINLENNTVEVVRKGGKKDFVRISDIALLDVRDYISIRNKRYKPARNMNALFIPSPESIHHSEGRLKVRSVQATIEKYAIAFGRPSLTVHKLRHSFATKHYQENKDTVALRRQLGHESSETTNIYTHVMDDSLRDAVNRADK